MNKTIKTKLISLFAVLLSICMLFSVASMVSTTAKAEYTTTAATLVEGASVRVKSAESSGLKFKAQLDKTQYNALYNQAGGKLKAGMIIVPSEYITAAGGYTFNAFEAAGKKVASNTIEQFKDASETTYEFTMSIIKLELANYDRDFEAIVYLESEVALDGFTAYRDKYYAYAERKEARNIYEVAKGVYNDRADVKDETKYIYEVNGKFATLDADGLAIAKTFIDGVTEIVLDNGKPAAYSSEYYAAKDSVLTNDTEAYLLGEHKNVVYKGESISSYPFTADGIAIKEMYTARATYANGEYTTAGYAIGGLTWSAGNAGNGTYGYVAFDGEYGPSTYVEFTFTGNNMPNVILYADDVTDGNMTHNSGGKGIAMINGISYDGTASTGRTTDLEVWAPYRWNGHYPGYNSYRYYGDAKVPMMKYFINNPTTEFRYVVGTYIVKEDVHNASGVVYGAEDEKDGVLEEVIYLDMAIYNNSTGASLYTLKTPLWAKNTTSSTATTDRVTTEDLSSGAIMAFSALKGADATTGDVLNTTFKVTKAPYHVHNYGSEIKSDATHHWYECALCGEAGEKAEHLGGTATHTEKAKCEVCGTAYGDLRANYDVDGVNLYNMSNVSASKVISKTKGELTFTATSTNWSGQNATIGIDEVFDDEFVKVGFTALAGDGTALNSSTASQLGVGFRRLSLSGASINSGWAAFGYDNGYGIFYGNTAGNSLHAGNGNYIGVGNFTNLKFVAGEQYYMVVGVTGTAPAEGETDNRTMYIFYLDGEENLIGGMGFTMARFLTTRPNATMAESGYFTIHSWATEERTLTYEIISGSQAAYYMNGGKGVEGLTVSGNTASWNAFSGATSYKVKVDNGEWVTADTNSLALAGLQVFNTYNVTVKAVCDGFETKETTTSFQYVPADVAFANVDMTTIKADGEISANKGTVTLTGSSAAIVLNDSFDTQFIKVGFTAAATYDATNSVFWNKAAALAIGFRRTASQTGSDASWALSSWGNANNLYIIKGGANGVVGGGFTAVSAGTASLGNITEGEKYYMLFGVTGTTAEDRVFHILWLDENDTVLVYYALAQADRSGIKELEMADAGCFTIHSSVEGERTISWEIIEAADVFKNANSGAIAKVKNTGATVSWDAVAGASEYLVSVNGGAYETVNTNSYTIANPVSFANYEVKVKANLGYYAATGSLNFVYTPAGLSVLNMTDISANNANTSSGTVTFTHDGEMSATKAATVVLDGNYTDDFIKVNFEALASAKENGNRVLCPYATYGISVGVRGVSTDNPRTNLAVCPRGDTNWVDIFGIKVPAHANMGVNWVRVNGHFDAIVAGDKLSIVTGVVGKGEDAVLTWILMKQDGTKLASWQLNYTEVNYAKAYTFADSGMFTIHSYGSGERTISYEIIDSATALALL